jgi:DNA polymerase III epsilon subunit-like protein
MINDLIAIDFETTGLDPTRDTILSIGACTASGSTFRCYVHPPRTWYGRRKKVPAAAARVNGYTPALWSQRGAVDMHTAARRFAIWLTQQKKEGARRPLAHNSGFDRAFLDALSRRTGVAFDIGHRWECSMAALSFSQRAGLIAPGPASLDHLARVSGQPRPAIHDALSDAQVCLTGYQFLLTLAQKKQNPAQPS